MIDSIDVSNVSYSKLHLIPNINKPKIDGYPFSYEFIA